MLFNLPTRDKDKATLLKKAKQAKVAKPKTSFVNPMEVVRQRVNEKLGKYKEKYKTITNSFNLKQYIDNCIEEGVVAIDTETCGLNPIMDNIVGFSLKSPNQPAVYVPINHISVFSRNRLENQLTEEDVREPLQYLVDNTATVWHNAIFDIRVLYWQLGVDVKDYNVYWDILPGSHILNENEPHGLKYLYNKYILIEDQEDEIFRFGDLFTEGAFGEVPIDIATIYAGHDAEMTLELYEFQNEFLDITNFDMGTKYSGLAYVFNHVEMPVIKVVVDMENKGIAVDIGYVKELSNKYNNLLGEAEQYFNTLVEDYVEDIKTYSRRNNNELSIPLNYNSPKQLSIFLYEILQVGVIDKRNPTGTGEDVLTQINHPICKAILKCREYKKLLSTYIDKISETICPKTERIHCRFRPTGTVTGRFSSNSPNLQNIPKSNEDIRKMFTASPNHVLISCDYS